MSRGYIVCIRYTHTHIRKKKNSVNVGVQEFFFFFWRETTGTMPDEQLGKTKAKKQKKNGVLSPPPRMKCIYTVFPLFLAAPHTTHTRRNASTWPAVTSSARDFQLAPSALLDGVEKPPSRRRCKPLKTKLEVAISVLLDRRPSASCTSNKVDWEKIYWLLFK